MPQTTTHPAAGPRQARRTNRASGRILLRLLILLALAIGGGIFLYWRAAKPGPANAAMTAEPVLSAATKATLKNLNAPVELRFYALLDPASVTNDLPAFASRVGLLLSAYERAADGRITVTRQTTPSDEAANAAAQDGLKAFNIEKGEACFLGITVAQKSQRESLAQLSLDWEAALESDLTRAIVRVTGTQSPAAASPEKARTEEAASAAVQSTFPDPDAVSVEEGTRRLRETAMKEFQEATKEVSTQLEAAQQKLQQALNGAPETEQQAARENLRQVQTAANRKLQQIAADAQARLVAWQRLKGVTPPPPKSHGNPPVSTPKR